MLLVLLVAMLVGISAHQTDPMDGHYGSTSPSAEIDQRERDHRSIRTWNRSSRPKIRQRGVSISNNGRIRRTSEKLPQDLDLTKVAESTTEEDQKFAIDVVAAHQVEAEVEAEIEAEDKAAEVEQSITKQKDNDNQKNKEKHNKKYKTMKRKYSCFRTVTGTMDTVRDIAANYPHLAKVVKVGKSYLGFKNKALVLTSKRKESNNHNYKKGVLFLTFGLHARELAPPELGIQWAEHLVTKYGIDADITQVLDFNEIHLLLHANPDGRRIVEEDPSLGKEHGWRKNAHDYPPYKGDEGNGCPPDYDYAYGTRTENNGTTYTYGVDLNRNFPYKWGEDGGSGHPCADDYRGPSPYSPEPEVAAIINYAKRIFPPEQQRGEQDVEASTRMEPYDENTTSGVYIDVHASGRIVGNPWWYKNITAPNLWELMALNHKFCSFNGHKALASGYHFWYNAPGASNDYIYAALGAASYTFEVGHDQAEDCYYFEKMVVPYNFHAFLYGAKVSRAPYRIPKGPDVTRLALSRPIKDYLKTVLLEVDVSDADRTYVKDKRGARVPDRYPIIPSGQQDIAEIQIFLDEHPYDDGNPLPYKVIKADDFYSPPDSARLDIDTSNLEETQHIVCVQAVDTDGYVGAVSCAFFNIDANNRFVKQCVDSIETFSLLNDGGSWRDRAKTCLDSATDANICDRVVKYRGTTLVRDVCPERCDLDCA